MSSRAGSPTANRVVSVVRRAARATEVRAARLERTAHRRLMAVGDRVECPICLWSGLSFAASRKPRKANRLCPECGSSERDRALHLWLGGQQLRQDAMLVEVAPIGLVEPLAETLGYAYTSVDLHSARAEVRGNLLALPFADRSIDMIVCFHVMEHVYEDREASKEMARVLRDDGTAVLSVPWNPEAAETEEDIDAPPEERLRRFGQIDHVRMYGRDVTDRLSAGGLHVEEVLWSTLFSERDFRRCALDGDDDRFWLCSPSPGPVRTQRA